MLLQEIFCLNVHEMRVSIFSEEQMNVSSLGLITTITYCRSAIVSSSYKQALVGRDATQASEAREALAASQ